VTLALTWYDWFKAAHVLAAVLWVGGGSMITLYALMTLRQNDAAELGQADADAAAGGSRGAVPDQAHPHDRQVRRRAAALGRLRDDREAVALEADELRRLQGLRLADQLS